MPIFPNSFCLLKGGLVLIDTACAAAQRIIALQYDLDTLNRTLPVQTGDGEFSR